MRTSKTIIGIALISMLLVACQQSDNSMDYDGLVSRLESNAAVEETGEVDQPFFSVKGKTLALNGESIQVYEYRSEAKAAKESSKISEDGFQIGNSVVDWIDEPHFFKKGKLIVLYVGKGQEAISLLESTLGSQFAGMKKESEITNFEDCAQAGYPIMESYPRQCRAGDKAFAEEIQEGKFCCSSFNEATGQRSYFWSYDEYCGFKDMACAGSCPVSTEKKYCS